MLAEIDRNAASSGEAERAYTELLARESAQSSALAECRTRITLLADKSQELLDQENAVATAAAEAAEHLAALETQAAGKADRAPAGAHRVRCPARGTKGERPSAFPPVSRRSPDSRSGCPA